MKTSATNRKLRSLITGIRDGGILPNPHFQRRLVWSTSHKVAFLDTVLEELPFPEIFTSAGSVNADTGDATELIVDGQQRITTLYQYFQGSRDLVLTGANFPPYKDLTQEGKIRFLEYEVVVRDLGPLGEQETRRIFQRINSTRYSLNAMEVNNSRFDGPLKRFAEEVAAAPLFEEKGVFKPLDIRRMNDTRFVLSLLITFLSGYSNRDDEHENYLEAFNEAFDEQEEMKQRLQTVVDFLQAADVPRSSRLWQKADLFTAIVELDRYFTNVSEPMNPAVFKDRVLLFFEEVDEVTRVADPHYSAAEYYRRVRSGINDRTAARRVAPTTRLEPLEKLLPAPGSALCVV